MDVDAHGETGEVLERADGSPGRLKGVQVAPKPISINLSRTLPARPPVHQSHLFFSFYHPCLPRDGHSFYGIAMRTRTVYEAGTVDNRCSAGPCIQNRQIIRRMPDQISQHRDWFPAEIGQSPGRRPRPDDASISPLLQGCCTIMSVFISRKTNTKSMVLEIYAPT